MMTATTATNKLRCMFHVHVYPCMDGYKSYHKYSGSLNKYSIFQRPRPNFSSLGYWALFCPGIRQQSVKWHMTCCFKQWMSLSQFR